MHEREIPALEVTFKLGQSIVIQSKNFIQGVAVPQFLIKLNENLSFETYHCGAVCCVPTLTANKVVYCKTWSCLEETMRFLSNKPNDHKKEVIIENLKSIRTKRVDEKLHIL